ncbi:hypothetical protein FDP41_001218 [Naegleria fowleri]|uniref:Uncharacterized protein n=1 Tax=Naegleria fowleri TaxID=5763 RepID=A0A6A5C3J7_NAEFO|nr:uncharacterized protein FDP41_001218 [Naegleria fowleri]KAF0980065.1 hypothetical protein FDP41_001218 [Naegleria fowleri]
MLPLYQSTPLSCNGLAVVANSMNHVGASPSSTSAMANIATMVINNFYQQYLARCTQDQEQINQFANHVKIAYLCRNVFPYLGNDDTRVVPSTSSTTRNDTCDDEQDHTNNFEDDDFNNNEEEDSFLDTISLLNSRRRTKRDLETLQFEPEEEEKRPEQLQQTPSILLLNHTTSVPNLRRSSVESFFEFDHLCQQEEEEQQQHLNHKHSHTNKTLPIDCTSFLNVYFYKEKQLESLFEQDQEEQENSHHLSSHYSSSLFKYTSEARKQHYLEEQVYHQHHQHNNTKPEMVQPVPSGQHHHHYSRSSSPSSKSSLSSSSSTTSQSNTPFQEDRQHHNKQPQQCSVALPQSSSGSSFGLPQFSTVQPSLMNTTNNNNNHLKFPQQPTVMPNQVNMMNPQSTSSFAFPYYFPTATQQQQPQAYALFNAPQPQPQVLAPSNTTANPSLSTTTTSTPSSTLSSSLQLETQPPQSQDQAMNRNFNQKKLSPNITTTTSTNENSNQVVQSGNNKYAYTSGFDQQNNILANPSLQQQVMTAAGSHVEKNISKEAQWLLRNMNQQQATNTISIPQSISKNENKQHSNHDTNNNFAGLAKFWSENIGTGTGEQGNANNNTTNSVTSGLSDIKELNTPMIENLLRIFNTTQNNGNESKTVGHDQPNVPPQFSNNSLFDTSANLNNNQSKNNIHEKQKSSDTGGTESKVLMIDPTKTAPHQMVSDYNNDESSSHSISRSSSGSMASDAGRSNISSSSATSGHHFGRNHGNGNEDRSWKVLYQDSSYGGDNALIKRPSFKLKTRTDNIMDQIPPILYSSLKYQFNIAVFLSTEKATQLLMSHKETLESIMHASAMSLGGFVIATIETALVGPVEEMEQEEDDELLSLVREEVNPTRKICNGVLNGDTQLALQPIEAIEATEAKAFKPFLYQLKQEIKEYEQANSMDAHKWSCVHNKTKIQFTDLPFHNKKSSFVMRVCFYLNHEFKERKPILIMESAPFKIFARRNKKSYATGAVMTGALKEEDASQQPLPTTSISNISSNVPTSSSSKQGATVSNKRKREEVKKKSKKVKKTLEPEQERETLLQFESELISLMRILDSIKDRSEHQAAVRSFIQNLVGPELAQQYMSHLRGKYSLDPSLMQLPSTLPNLYTTEMPSPGVSTLQKKSKAPFASNLSVDTKSLGKLNLMQAARLIPPTLDANQQQQQQQFLQQAPFLNPATLAFHPLVNIPNLASSTLAPPQQPFLSGMNTATTTIPSFNIQPTSSLYSGSTVPATTTSSNLPSSLSSTSVPTAALQKTSVLPPSQASNDMMQSIGQQNVLELISPSYQSSSLFDFTRSPTGFGNISTPRFSSTTTYSPLGMMPSSTSKGAATSTAGFLQSPSTQQQLQGATTSPSTQQQPQGEARDTSGIRPPNLIQILQPQNKIDFNKLKSTNTSTSDTSFMNDYLSELLEDNANSNNILSPINLFGTPTSANLGSDLPSFNFFERNSQSSNNTNNINANTGQQQQQQSESELQDPLTPKTLAFLTQSKLV